MSFLKADQDGVVFEMPGVFLRTEFNYDMDKASLQSGFVTEGPSLAQQQFKEECDINTIVNRFGLTGELPKDVAVPQSGDFTNVVDFQSALNLVIAAERAFDAMPWETRKRFNNDPAEFMAFVDDEKNRDEAQKMGLLMPPKAAPEPVAVKVISEPEAK